MIMALNQHTRTKKKKKKNLSSPKEEYNEFNNKLY